MPVIPTYDAKAGLDPDTRGMPRVNFDESQFKAAAAQGVALQGLGSELSSIGQRAAQQQQEAATFATGLQSRALQQDLQNTYQEGLKTIPANGTGFAQSFREQADQVAQGRFSQMPAGPARDRAMQEWQTVGRDAWANHAFETEYKQQGVYSTQHIGQMQDGDLASVAQNPAMADALMDKARGMIMNAPGLTTAQKVDALADYQRNLYGTELQARHGTDGEGMREALHMATPGTPGATFSRMVDAESGGNPAAISRKGALGIAQVMPDTAREVAHDMGLTQVAGMSDGQLQSFFADHPDMNRQIGRTYFSQLVKRYNGDQEAAVVAYNAGPARADAWLKRGKDDDVLPPETIAYKAKVLGPDGSAIHSVTTANSPLGSVAFDGAKATINGKTFSGPSPAVSVARQFAGMDEKSNRDTLSAFIAKACGQQVDPSRIPWCASFADAVLGASGKQTLGSARAADFLNYGAPTNAPSQGDVVVFKPQGTGLSGHVGFVVGIEGDTVRYIAGNDGNRVQESTLPLAQVVGFRVPPPAQQAGPDGGVFNGRYAALTFGDRQRLIAGADAGQVRALAQQQQQDKLDQFNTGRMVDDDIQSLTATGKGVDGLDANRVAAVLGPQKADQWQAQRSQALDVFKATAGMDAMSNDQLAQHAEQFRPGEQDAGEGFGRRQATFQSVSNHAEALLKMRAEDPASAVARAPNVAAAQARIAGGDTSVQAQEGLVQARLAAQSAVGIPDYVQSPIPLDEAKLLAAKMRPLSSGQAQAADQARVIDGIVQEIGTKYGKYAPDVLKRVMYQVTLKKSTSEVLARALQRAQASESGSVVTADEAARVQGERQADTLARQSGAGAAAAPQAGAAYPTPEGSIMRAYDQRESYPAAFEGATSESLATPPSRKGSYVEAVDALQKDPDRLLPFFVQRYGAARVPANLRSKAGAAR